MYPISDYAYNLYMRQYRQVLDITVNTANESFHITEKDILQNNFFIDRYCISGNTIEIGSAIAAELNLKIDNNEGKYDDIIFEGAEMFVRVGIKKWDEINARKTEIEYIPCGYFTVDEPPRKLSAISISALDRMVLFDKPFDASLFIFPMPVGRFLERCCEVCNVQLQTDINTLINNTYMVNNPPVTENITYRQIVQWIGEITGTCGYIDWDGKLRMEWYKDTPTKITSSVRYSSDFYDKDITVTGVIVEDVDQNVYLSGSEGYVINIVGNDLVQHDHQLLAASLMEKIGGFTYRAYNCTTKSMPHIYPLDIVAYVDKLGKEHKTIVTHHKFKLGGRTSISAKGKTVAESGYAAANPLTKREKTILAAMKKQMNEKLEANQQAALALNEVISNSLGLYRTCEEKENGSLIYYYHNGQTLENSNIIYTFREGGFAWSDKWAGEETIWQYGLTKDGNAVLNVLSAYKITAENITAGAILVGDESSPLLWADKLTDVVTIGGFDVKRTSDKGYIARGKKAYNDSSDGVYLGTDGIGLGNNKFHVSSAGYLHSLAGEIGGWQINGTVGFVKENDDFKVHIRCPTTHGSPGTATADVIVVTDKTGDADTYPFVVTSDGTVIAEKAIIRGSSEIGGDCIIKGIIRGARLDSIDLAADSSYLNGFLNCNAEDYIGVNGGAGSQGEIKIGFENTVGPSSNVARIIIHSSLNPQDQSSVSYIEIDAGDIRLNGESWYSVVSRLDYLETILQNNYEGK